MSPDQSPPTSSIQRVLLTLAITLILATVIDARGIVHAGVGMPDGPLRSAVSTIGGIALPIANVTHLDWPWNRLSAALGQQLQTNSPLLAGAPGYRRSDPPTLSAILGLRRLKAAPALAAPPRRPSPKRLFTPTHSHRLRLLVTGDSLTGYLGPDLINDASAVGPVRGFVDTHDGTGLTRPDFVDWSLLAKQQIAADRPDAVVVMLGGNDFQNMVMPGGRVLVAGTPTWTREYQRRAAVCMRIWLRQARRVYWLSTPPARDPAWAFDDGKINIALRRAARSIPGTWFLNVLGPVTNHGRYSDFVLVNGQELLVREPDGVHLNIAGSALVAQEVLHAIVHEWHLGGRAIRPQVHRSHVAGSVGQAYR
ncbi:MAG: DUF459 domain-containing protein [Chloroflexota bacterium]